MTAVHDDRAGEPDRRPAACSHQWTNRDDPPITRAAYSPVIGPGRHEMKAGETYHCRNCGSTLRPGP